MSTSKTTREHISAFADGELADSQVDMVLAALRQPVGNAAWDVYHQIGDMLRSNDAAVDLSSDFAARMAARLHAEPSILALLFVFVVFVCLLVFLFVVFVVCLWFGSVW